eukprot:13142200-Ditylum_brightwellii.AAC.1
MKGKYYTYKLYTISYSTNSLKYDLEVPFYDNRSVEEWLKFWQNLQAIINRQNITDTHSMYAITKIMLQGDMLTAFKMQRE